MRPQSQRGVALVITLVMLSVVTLMAITFLAVSRRERAAVAVSEYQITSRLMSDTALARAQADIVSRLLATRSFLGYDYRVSTNLSSPYGFDTRQAPGLPNFTNVNYDFVLGDPGTPLTENQRLQALGNLMFDARPPVYVATNADSRFPLDFRFFLDLNRNGRFETNGVLPVLDALGQPVVQDVGNGPQVVSNRFVGDPEWIGELQHPDAPHSGTNRFVGRFAYLVLPAGRSLDLNFVHNNALTRDLSTPAFQRNQGVGSWELNLAAFLHDLNTNAWPNYRYLSGVRQPVTPPFAQALGFLGYRYGGNYNNLFSVEQLFGATGRDFFARDTIDQYSDGPFVADWRGLTADNDQTAASWPGSENPRSYFELNDLFDVSRVPAAFTNNLGVVQSGLASYDRYTLYRLLGQMGMDSRTTARQKINLNYDNVSVVTNNGFQARLDATNLVSWEPLTFFETAARRLLETASVPTTYTDNSGQQQPALLIGDTLVRTNFALTNILVYPVNEYSPTVHRLLQLAVNLYDATTNRASLTGYPYLPTVIQPRFSADGTNIFVSGFREVTNTTLLAAVPLDLRDPVHRNDMLRLGQNGASVDRVVYDVPLLIGAKKGFPNFNEFAMLNAAQVSRRAEAVKTAERDRIPVQTNLMYLVTISNRFGIEFWNSYSQAYPRPLRLRLAGDVRMGLTNSEVFAGTLAADRYVYAIEQTNSTWPGKRFEVPVLQSRLFLPEAVYQPLPRPHLQTDGVAFFQRGLGFYVPQMELVITNRFYCALIDQGTDRIVDYVAFGDMSTRMNLTAALAGRGQAPGATGIGGEPGNVWLTNRVQNVNALNVPTVGVIDQMEISLGNIPVSDQQWRSYNRTGPGAYDKDKAIDLFREFCGLTPLRYNTPRQRAALRAELSGRIAVQAPYTPTRKVYQEVLWQVDDPLVHYLVGDLLDPRNRPSDPLRTNTVRFAVPPSVALTNSNLGLLNDRYRPWGGNPNQSYDLLSRDPAVKDPGVYSSDDWEFPTNKLPSLGWIGRVHRGTPWQTVYLKSAVADTNQWYLHAGSFGTHPTNDWPLLQIFTTAPNDPAGRGLLGVNQEGLAAWSAVFSGISVLTNTTPVSGHRTDNEPTFDSLLVQPNSPQLRAIVDGINRTRQEELMLRGMPVPAFDSLGRLLATPELTINSPYINTNNLLNDAIMERIPQQILSLVKEDEPRFVIYAFGQSLREAPGSVYVGPGAFNRMCTNYVVTGESVSKSVVRIEGSITNPRAVVESYNEVFSE